MQDILFTIFTFSIMLITFKYFEVFGVNNLQAIIVNYITAGSMALASCYIYGISFAPVDLVSSEYKAGLINLHISQKIYGNEIIRPENNDVIK